MVSFDKSCGVLKSILSEAEKVVQEKQELLSHTSNCPLYYNCKEKSICSSKVFFISDISRVSSNI